MSQPRPALFNITTKDRSVTAKKNATPTKKKQPLEKDLNKKIVQWLDLMPGVIWFERINSGKVQTAWGTWIQLAKKGTPDFIALIHGGDIAHVLFIEAKRKGEIKKDGTSRVMEQNWFKEKVSIADNIHYILINDVLQMIDKINSITYFNDDKKIPS